jgi:hypothetical protein
MTYFPPKKGVEFITYISLEATAGGSLVASPTIAAGDFKVSIDGGALANLATLPTNTPAASGMVKITLSTSEMNGDNITVKCIDAAGDEWLPVTINIPTSTRQIDDLATQTSVDTIDDFLDTEIAAIKTKTDFLPSATAGAAGGLMIAGSNAAATFASMTCTGSFTISDGLLVSRSTSNTSAITATGNGTGSGAVFTSGSGATGDGIKAVAASTNGNGLTANGNGTGAGFFALSNTTGPGAFFSGGGTSGEGIVATATGNSAGFKVTGAGTGNGILATSGGGATGDGIKAIAASTNGNGMELVGTGTGSDLLANVKNITAGVVGNITGNLSGSVGSVTGAVGSVTGNVGGNVTGSVGSVAAGGITAASIATDAIDADAIAADAVTEIQSGLATAASLATVAGYLDTEIAAILADTNELQTDWVDGGRLDLLVDAIKAKTDNLPASPAAVGSAMTLTAAYDAAKTAATQASVDTVDTVVDAIKAKTDSLTFTVAGQVDSNIQSVNDVTVTGTGAAGDEWGP